MVTGGRDTRDDVPLTTIETIKSFKKLCSLFNQCNSSYSDTSLPIIKRADIGLEGSERSVLHWVPFTYQSSITKMLD